METQTGNGSGNNHAAEHTLDGDGDRHDYTEVNFDRLYQDAREQSLTRLQSFGLLHTIEAGISQLRRQVLVPKLGPLAVAGDDVRLWN